MAVSPNNYWTLSRSYVRYLEWWEELSSLPSFSFFSRRPSTSCEIANMLRKGSSGCGEGIVKPLPPHCGQFALFWGNCHCAFTLFSWQPLCSPPGSCPFAEMRTQKLREEGTCCSREDMLYCPLWNKAHRSGKLTILFFLQLPSRSCLKVGNYLPTGSPTGQWPCSFSWNMSLVPYWGRTVKSHMWLVNHRVSLGYVEILCWDGVEILTNTNTLSFYYSSSSPFSNI